MLPSSPRTPSVAKGSAQHSNWEAGPRAPSQTPMPKYVGLLLPPSPTTPSVSGGAPTFWVMGSGKWEVEGRETSELSHLVPLKHF